LARYSSIQDIRRAEEAVLSTNELYSALEQALLTGSWTARSEIEYQGYLEKAEQLFGEDSKIVGDIKRRGGYQ
jgi:hypothetical protein